MAGSDLSGFEKPWVKLYHFLMYRGYRLRPRYDPEYVPTLVRKKRICHEAWYHEPEDEIDIPVPGVLDAVRLADGTKVVLRKAATWRDEVPILQKLKHLQEDTRNHIVPILDTILLPDTDEHVLLVMPFLREYYDPPFSCPAQVIHALSQFLETLEFLHEQNIAHRDFCRRNLMMNSDELVPGGFHFAAAWCDPTGRPGLVVRDRGEVPPVQYFVIDFGLSSCLPSRTSLVTGRFGQDKTVPELSWDVPYNPFKVDIYQLGQVILQDMVNVYSDLEFLRPLAAVMTHANPSYRPDIDEAIAVFQKTVEELPGSVLQQSIHVVDREFGYLLARRPVPRRLCFVIPLEC
ncbi:kinase-like domain-containing protein [Schizophyllum amplum]|uniref:Kinase-like domain-containing protein n=1 Tax=Schizophyllum amplum TaxID=97359 RepID=A0A550C8J8_9AGAR|nr:kinase-like domain-containing protein [Auriculariopsis ampla]